MRKKILPLTLLALALLLLPGAARGASADLAGDLDALAETLAACPAGELAQARGIVASVRENYFLLPEALTAPQRSALETGIAAARRDLSLARLEAPDAEAFARLAGERLAAVAE